MKRFLAMDEFAAENKRLRETIRRLEKEKQVRRKTQFIANAADQLLTMIDRNYIYESVNEAYCRARGQCRNDVVGKTVAEVWGDEQFRSIIKPKLDHCFDGQLTSSEHWFAFDGQERRCYQVAYNPYFDENNQVTHAVVVTHDITARKQTEADLKKAHDRLERRVAKRTAALEQANLQLRNEIEERKRVEKALRDSEDRYRSVSRDMPAMVCRYLPNGTLTFANLRFAYYFQIHEKDIGKINIFSISEAIGRRWKQQRLNNLHPAKPMVTYEQSTHMNSGELRWHQWTDRALFDDQGNAMEYQSIVIDITEKKDFENKLQQAQKMEAIGTLAGGIAHDFNNLLMGIQGNISLMDLDVDDSHPLYENIRSIEQLVDSGANLTRQLLGFARGGKYVIKPINLNEVVAKTAALFGRTRKTIRIHEAYDPNICTVLADRGQIEQVLINLYLNAWQAMFKKGDLYLETKIVDIGKDFAKPFDVRHGQYVRVSVTDTGNGIDPSISHRIFDPFFTTKEIGCGSGLGLASVFGIVKNHDGIVDFDTQTGRGTTFNVYLPVSNETQSETPSCPGNIIKGPETILLVDDETYILDVGEKMLSKMGYTVLRARSGKDAVGIFIDFYREIDLVIMDMIMPDICGDELYDQLKKIKSSIKVLLASGHSKVDAATTMEKGCNGYIQKPFSIQKLSHAIREVIDTGRHQPGP